MPDRLATTLLRVARDPASGRLRNPGPLASGLRAALFTDLILTGRVRGYELGPVADEPSETGERDRILDAVQHTVARRPDVAWWRWFRHVRVDRVALVDELVTAQRWTPHSGGLRAAYDDVDAPEALERSQRVQRVLRGEIEPADSREAVLGVLTVMCGSIVGRPHPRALRRSIRPLVEAAGNTGERGAAQLPDMLLGAARLLKRPLRRGG